MQQHDDFNPISDALQEITLQEIAAQCYENGIPKKRFLVQIKHWFACRDCGEAVARVDLPWLRQFTADVEWLENNLGLLRPFADLLSEHHCSGGAQ